MVLKQLQRLAPILGQISNCITFFYGEDTSQPNTKKGKMWEALQDANRNAIGALAILENRLQEFESAYGEIQCDNQNQQPNIDDMPNFGDQVWNNIWSNRKSNT